MHIRLLGIGFFVLTILFNPHAIIAQSKAPLEIHNIAPNIFVYTTYHTYKGELFPANGLFVVSSQGVIIVDSPWDTTQFQPLLDTIYSISGKKAVISIGTHFHDDRIGGIDFFKQNGISTYTSRYTDSILQARSIPRSAFHFERDTVFQMGDTEFRTFYPGPGHTQDNIVIWFPKQKILYGGCLIKTTSDSNLGNTADGDTKEYVQSVRKVKRKYSDAKLVIPGHKQWGGIELVQHTLM
ncbi:MAG: subclass B1 metallo-beta-lactamase, partial [Sediminibacterium sp.]|nr:subclass B1 metallo-beta-lactamase [Sediminibacterium sp.]